MALDYENNIKVAIQFIESKLNTRIKTKDVAKASAYSLFHFHRIFQVATGYTLKKYMRVRKLTEAARLLINTKIKIIDIAFDYGFESQESFTRAFRKAFGVTPGKCRKDHIHYSSIYKNKFTIDQLLFRNKGGKMIPEIKEKNDFKVIGLRYFGTNSNNEIFALWHQFFQQTDKIENIAQVRHFYGICSSSKTDLGGSKGKMEFEYIAGAIVTTLDVIPAGMVGRKVLGGKYAVFTHKGPISCLQDTYKYIYGEWATKGGYTILGTLDFEFYNEKFDPSGSEDSELYIYIPIK
ncbi:MAG: AraC family transcriptional regulator [Desulfobacteraceae bacterium]|nr:AraC family transcriptional regulator [Desulfobacteraceae bacterium]